MCIKYAIYKLSILNDQKVFAAEIECLNCFYPIFAKNNYNMTTTNRRSRGLYWILFFISIAVFFGVYAIGGGYCSMILPFNVTFFALALDLM